MGSSGSLGMNAFEEDDRAPSSHGKGLREVAAYLRGVADAAAAFHVEPPVQEVAWVSAPTEGRDRRTLPYGVVLVSLPPPAPVRVPTLHAAAPAPANDDLADLEEVDDLGDLDESWDNERHSAVRLRVARLPAEWYDLAGGDD